MRVLLVGHDFMPYRTSGDKNYWLEMVPHLDSLDWLGVFSINHGGDARSDIGSARVEIYNAPPVYALTRLRPDRDPKGSKCAGDFKRAPAAMLDGPLTILRHAKTIRGLVRSHDVDVVHFMDNFGLAARMLRRLLRSDGVCVSMSYLGLYRTTNARIRYLRTCASNLDALVVANPAMASALGLKESAVTIQWAAMSQGLDGGGRHATSRAKLGLGPGERLVLWSGYLQQLREAEFHLACEVVSKVAARCDGVRFVFLVKPECWTSVHATAARELGLDIRVSESEEFLDHLDAADVLFSPVATSRTVVTPPLTWIEIMQRGAAVVTTDVPGAKDALGPWAETHSVAEDDLARVLEEVLHALPDREAIATWANSAYDLQFSASKYVKIWEDTSRSRLAASPR